MLIPIRCTAPSRVINHMFPGASGLQVGKNPITDRGHKISAFLCVWFCTSLPTSHRLSQGLMSWSKWLQHFGSISPSRNSLQRVLGRERCVRAGNPGFITPCMPCFCPSLVLITAAFPASHSQRQCRDTIPHLVHFHGSSSKQEESLRTQEWMSHR